MDGRFIVNIDNMYISMAWRFQAGELVFVCINNALCLYEFLPVQTKCMISIFFNCCSACCVASSLRLEFFKVAL